MPRKKLTPQQAKAMLMADGMDFQQDFHALGSSAVQALADVAKLAGYRKSKNAPGSTARMFYQYLSRVEPVVRTAGQLTSAERRAYQERARKKKTPSQAPTRHHATRKPVARATITQAVASLGPHYAKPSMLKEMGWSQREIEAAVRRGDLAWLRDGGLKVVK